MNKQPLDKTKCEKCKCFFHVDTANNEELARTKCFICEPECEEQADTTK